MILNAYAVLDGFLCLLRLVLGLGIVGLGLQMVRAKATDTQRFEERAYLLFLSAFVVIGLAALSWPVLYLLLQSYVAEWPGVMCIYGVTQIGTGSLGPSRFLQELLRFLQFSKPALVFAGGAWLVLYLLNRRTQSAPLARRVVGVVLVIGFLAVADALAETTYLLIPKKQETSSAGCCAVAFDGAGGAARLLPSAWLVESHRPWLYGGYYAVNGAMALALFVALRFGRGSPGSWGLLLALMALSVVVNAVFLVEAAAPLLLHLPYHHCPYDLLPQVPESMGAIALFFLGAFAVGWAAVAAGLGRHHETASFLPSLIKRLLNLALFGYLASLLMMSVELALAWAQQSNGGFRL